MIDAWAAVPVKEFAGAKQRLAPMLCAAQRELLAATMLEDVLTALVMAPLAGIVVNTADPRAAALAARCGARVVTQAARDGHTAAVAAMAALLAAEGAAAMLTLPGDIPLVTAAEVAALCEACPSPPALTISPAHDERGSNAVLVAPPQAVPLQFGDDSFVPHLRAARSAGIEPVIIASPGIGLDIDQPEDVRRFLRATPSRHTRTARLLREWIATGQTA